MAFRKAGTPQPARLPQVWWHALGITPRKANEENETCRSWIALPAHPTNVAGPLSLHIGLKSHRLCLLRAAELKHVKKKLHVQFFISSAIALFCAVVSAQDFPILDKIADKVIQKYQSSTCEQLWQQKAREKGKTPESPMEQRALEMLKSDPQMRQAFISKVAAPIANKMFECGMIP